MVIGKGWEGASLVKHRKETPSSEGSMGETCFVHSCTGTKNAKATWGTFMLALPSGLTAPHGSARFDALVGANPEKRGKEHDIWLLHQAVAIYLLIANDYGMPKVIDALSHGTML